MRIIICDDDILIQQQLNKLLHEYFDKAKVKCPEIIIYDCGEKLLADTGSKDIIFLDIEMPGFNGIYVGAELKKANDKVIIFIVTSFSEYLDDAMRFQVFRYLSKPIEHLRLFRNLKDALQLYSTSTNVVAVETKDTTHTLPLSDIVFIETLGHTVIVHTIAGDYKSVEKMAYWANTLLSRSFFQSHRSYIINLHHVSSFDHAMIYLYNNHFKAYLTKRKYQEFKTAYFLYLESVR